MIVVEGIFILHRHRHLALRRAKPLQISLSEYIVGELSGASVLACASRYHMLDQFLCEQFRRSLTF